MARRTIRFAARSRAAAAFKKSVTYLPPRGTVGSADDFAHLLSGNILYDPGVELFIGNTVGTLEHHVWNERTGEDHFTLPTFDDSCGFRQSWPNGSCLSYWDQSQWVSLGTPYRVTGDVSDSAWHVTRLNPFLGQLSMVWWRWSKGAFGNPLSLMVLSPGLPGGYSARVEPGDLITWSVRARIYDYEANILNGAAGDPTISPFMFYYTKSGTPIVGGGDYYQPMDTDYTEYSYQASAPSGSYFLRAMVAFVANNPSAYTLGNDPILLVDSGVLSIE
jgi:hypothetical protein